MNPQPETNNSPPSSSDGEDKADLFKPVLAALNRTQLPVLARSILEAQKSEKVSEPSVGNAIYGSYHAILPLTFDDGAQWAIKIPVNGTEEGWNDMSSSALTSEAETMRLLGRETTIPIPVVFDFSSTLGNPLCCPYILMSFVTGFSLYDIWFSHRLGDTSVEENQANRVRALDGIALAMVQLGKFSSHTGGQPHFSKQGGEISAVGSFRQLDHKAMIDRWIVHGDPAEDPIYVELEPYADQKGYYTAMLDLHTEDQRVLRGLEHLLRQFIDWVPDTLGPDPFVLSHPDFDIENFIVSENGDLMGIIGWDGVAFKPRSIGNERYPGWLTRDWNPIMYGYYPSMDEGAEFEGGWEDSPTTSAEYREIYGELMARHRGVGNPNFCQMSLITGILAIAASNPDCRGQILRKLVDKVWDVLGVKGPRYLGLVHMLIHGGLDDVLLNDLKAGFRALLSKDRL